MQLIETPRLLLRALTPDVYKQVFTTVGVQEQMEFFGCRNPEELKEERKKFEEGLSMYRKSLLLFQLLSREGRRVLGWCGYHTWYTAHHRAEIGYVMSDEESRGKGLMKEALPAVLKFGFSDMGLHRVEALVGADNTPSLRLLGANGFVQEGVLREHYLVNGVYEDSLVFSLLKHGFAS